MISLETLYISSRPPNPKCVLEVKKVVTWLETSTELEMAKALPDGKLSPSARHQGWSRRGEVTDLRDKEVTVCLPEETHAGYGRHPAGIHLLVGSSGGERRHRTPRSDLKSILRPSG